MATLHAQIGPAAYRTSITTGTGHALAADEPEAQGGGNTGPTPSELMGASLAACTLITVRMYANRKGWPLTAAKVDIGLERNSRENTTHIRRDITLTGDLGPEQRQRLLDVANKCPMHQVLTHTVTIDTVLV
jgi:putative redox protein